MGCWRQCEGSRQDVGDARSALSISAHKLFWSSKITQNPRSRLEETCKAERCPRFVLTDVGHEKCIVAAGFSMCTAIVVHHLGACEDGGVVAGVILRQAEITVVVPNAGVPLGRARAFIGRGLVWSQVTDSIFFVSCLPAEIVSICPNHFSNRASFLWEGWQQCRRASQENVRSLRVCAHRVSTCHAGVGPKNDFVSPGTCELCTQQPTQGPTNSRSGRGRSENQGFITGHLRGRDAAGAIVHLEALVDL